MITYSELNEQVHRITELSTCSVICSRTGPCVTPVPVANCSTAYIELVKKAHRTGGQEHV